MAVRLQGSSVCLASSLIPRLSRGSVSCNPSNSSSSRVFSSVTRTRQFVSPRKRFAIRARRGELPTPIVPKQQSFASEQDLRFESPLKIVQYPDPILRAKNKRINTFDDNLKNLVREMFDIMYKTDGIGLSAPQVGVNVQLMVFNEAGEPGVGEEMVLVNPVVYKSSKKNILFNEGCLSFPGIFADVVRPATIKVDARDINGARFRINMSELSARIFQHEFDHLLGVLFFDRMSSEVLETIRIPLKDLEKKYEEKTGKPSPESVDNILGIKEVARLPQD